MVTSAGLHSNIAMLSNKHITTTITNNCSQSDYEQVMTQYGVTYLSLHVPAGIVQWCFSVLVSSTDAGLMFFYQVGSDIQVSVPASIRGIQ